MSDSRPRAAAGAYSASLCVNPDTGRPLGFAGYEYLDQILHDGSRQVVVQKGAQVGATVMAVLRALWFVHERRAHTLYLFPTHRAALRFSRGRFAVLLESSRLLRELFAAGDRAEHRRAGHVNFYCHGARSRTELLSTPVQYLTLDERDALHDGEPGGRQPWSAAELARQRLAGQRQGWELAVSTPSLPGHGVHAEFAASDQQRFRGRCPRCEALVEIDWPGGVSGLEEGGEEGTAAAFRCPHCQAAWSDRDRRQALRQGLWRPAAPGRRRRGYQLSQLLSPVAEAQGLLERWRESETRPAARQVFFNSVLGLAHAEEGERITAEWIDAALARGRQEAAAGPGEGCVMGIDVGPCWLHAVAAQPVTGGLRVVWIGRKTGWTELSAMIDGLRVRSFVVDAMPETHQARKLVQTRGPGWLCYYRPPGSAALADPRHRTLCVPRTDSLDNMVELWREGRVSLPRETPAEFRRHLAALVRVVRIQRDGRVFAEYADSGQPDHYAHAMNYCVLAWRMRQEPLRFEVTPPGEGWDL